MVVSPDRELLLRIIVEHPPPGVRFRVQRGAKELEPPARMTKTALVFEFPVRIGAQPNGDPNFLGPFTQGRPAGRFVYINSGTLAGQTDSCWSRRAKIPLTSITWALIEQAQKKGSPLETSITGTGRDGGPACAAVPLRGGGWRVARVK